MLRILRLVIFTLLASSPAWAGYIRGRIRFDNRQPADHVILRLRGEAIAFQSETQSDAQGKFAFEGLPLSTFILTIEGQGFYPYSSHIDISMSKMSYEDITLRLEKQPEANVPPEGPQAAVDARLAQLPADARREFLTAEKLLNQDRDLEGGIKHLRRAIQLHDNFPEAYLMLGMIYLSQRKFEDSTSALQKSTELAPTSGTAFLGLGAVYNQEKKYEEAEKVLVHGLELAPEAAEGLYELSKTYWAMGRWQEAEPHAQKAVALKPDLAAPHVLLGNIALRKRDTPAALKEFQEYLRLDPAGPMAEGARQMVAKIEAALKTAP